VFYSDPFGLLVLSALVNGIVAAPFLIVTMLIAGDPQVMGKRRNGKIALVLGWATAFIMSAAAVIGLLQSLGGRRGAPAWGIAVHAWKPFRTATGFAPETLGAPRHR
jgi:hypothetical protein